MKLFFSLRTLVIFLFLSSCVKSLYPITSNSQDIIFKKELMGNWRDAKGTTEYIVDELSKTTGKKYKVSLIDHSKSADTSKYLMILVNLKGHYFLDCMPDTSEGVYSKISDWDKVFLLPTHFFIKVYSISKNSIIMSPIDKDALSLLFKTGKIKMKHENLEGDDILLSEKSEKLQEKLLELDKFPSIYSKDSLIRVK